MSPSKEKFLRVLSQSLNNIPTLLCQAAIPLDGSVQLRDPQTMETDHQTARDSPEVKMSSQWVHACLKLVILYIERGSYFASLPMGVQSWGLLNCCIVTVLGIFSWQELLVFADFAALLTLLAAYYNGTRVWMGYIIYLESAKGLNTVWSGVWP